MSDFSYSALLVFCKILANRGLLDEVGGDAVWLYNALKPVLLEKAAQAAISLKGAIASVVEKGANLIYYLAGSQVFWVSLAAGVSVLAQLRLEKAGYPTAGKVAGATGLIATGAAVGLLLVPGAAPLVAAGAIATGGFAGFGVWSAFDKLKTWSTNANVKEIHVHFHCQDIIPM